MPSIKPRCRSAKSAQPLSFAGISPFRVRRRGRPTFRPNLGPETGLHDLEDLLALGMKNYEARQSRSCSQGPINGPRWDALGRVTRNPHVA